jgi:hypothetical protein
MTDETKTATKAAPVQYESTALATPVKADPPAGRMSGGGGGRPAEDVIKAAQVLLANRDEWYLVAEKVANPGRFYDGFRGQGARVRVSKTGDTVTAKDAQGQQKELPTYNVYAMIPAGEVVPWKKGKSAEESGGRTPVQSAPTSNVAQLPQRPPDPRVRPSGPPAGARR